MNEQRRQILEMPAEGKVTADEAERLIRGPWWSVPVPDVVRLRPDRPGRRAGVLQPVNRPASHRSCSAWWKASPPSWSLNGYSRISLSPAYAL
jgi:hypothetical protein